MDNYGMTVGDFHTTLPTVHRTSRQRVHEETEALNSSGHSVSSTSKAHPTQQQQEMHPFQVLAEHAARETTFRP